LKRNYLSFLISMKKRSGFDLGEIKVRLSDFSSPNLFPRVLIFFRLKRNGPFVSKDLVIGGKFRKQGSSYDEKKKRGDHEIRKIAGGFVKTENSTIKRSFQFSLELDIGAE